jgi:NADH dehydrogenase
MRIVIIGAGFAGMYAALSAARLRDIKGVSPEELEIALVAPEPTLVIRPRLYEPKPETLTAPLLDVLKAVDVVYIKGSAETIDTASRTVQVATANNKRQSLSYDRLVVATGSRLFRPNIPGLAEHGFSVDNLDDAIALDKHLHGLANRPASNGRDTIVVAGGGFTGIEAATEIPARLRAILGKDARPRVIIVERNSAIAPDMGEGPRPIIEEALRKLGVETRLGAGVASLDASGITLSDGERIETETVIWAAGIRAAPLTTQIPAERDNFGRLLVDRDLRVPLGAWRLCHRRRRQSSQRRCRQLRADVVPACDADGRLCRQQCRRRTIAHGDQAISPEGLRHLSRPRRSRRTVHARLGPQGRDGWRRRQEDQAGNQHRLDLSAEGRACRRSRLGRSGACDRSLAASHKKEPRSMQERGQLSPSINQEDPQMTQTIQATQQNTQQKYPEGETHEP